MRQNINQDNILISLSYFNKNNQGIKLKMAFLKMYETPREKKSS